MTRTNIDKLLREAAHYRIQEYPEVRTYYRNPSLKNAEALLDAFSLHVPFRSKHAIVSTKRKAVSLPILQTNKNKQRNVVTVHGGSPTTFQKKIRNLSHIDFLHDIHSSDETRLKSDIYDPILLPLHLNATQYAKISRICGEKVGDGTFSSNIANSIESMFDKHPKRIVMERLTTDTMLYEMVGKWMQLPSLQVVMDGIIENIKQPNGKTVRSLCLAAFFSLLLGKCPPTFIAPGPLPQGTQCIDILTGAFQTMDGNSWGKFIGKYISSFNQTIQSVQMVLRHISDISQPYDSTVMITSSHITLDNVYTVPLTTTSKTVSRLTGYQYVVEFEKSMYASYPKKELKMMMDEYEECTDAEKKQLQPFLQRLIRINFMRDMYKADVAIQRGAVYMTIDRNAYLYYTLRCEKEGKELNGMYYYPKTTKKTEVVVEL